LPGNGVNTTKSPLPINNGKPNNLRGCLKTHLQPSLRAFSSACPAAGQGSNLPIWGISTCYEEIASAPLYGVPKGGTKSASQ
jgi:hypothetical protein